MWEINGLQIECDIEDIETAEKVENALKKMAETNPPQETDTSLSCAIKFHCNTIKQLFSDVFGTEITEKIFEGVKLNRRIYTDILYSFYDYLSVHKQDMTRRAKAVNKYIPAKK